MRLTGAKRPQVEYWVRKGLIAGEFEHGTGLPRQFVFRNLVETAIAIELTIIGVSTDIASSMLSELRSGDIETDVRTHAFVGSTKPRIIKGPAKFSKKQQAELDAAYREHEENTPREEMRCADLNDDGTLKLLRLLRSYVEEGVSDAAARKALTAVAEEHNRDLKTWHKEREDFLRRWRQFKQPDTRPRKAQFWLIGNAMSEDEGRWFRTKLTDFKDDNNYPNGAAIAIPLRGFLERLEEVTKDYWRATPEDKVFKMPPGIVPARQLVDQAFKEYEKAERIKELRALGKLPPPREHRHHG
jgi:hypothetical protein